MVKRAASLPSVTGKQLFWINVLAGKNVFFILEHDVYIPDQRDLRTFKILEAKGLIEYKTRNQGHAENGYALTDLGRAVFDKRSMFRDK